MFFREVSSNRKKGICFYDQEVSNWHKGVRERSSERENASHFNLGLGVLKGARSPQLSCSRGVERCRCAPPLQALDEAQVRTRPRASSGS